MKSSMKALLRAMQSIIRAESRISAQQYLIKFYEKHGFEVEGDIYDEDGIPHVQMVKNG